MPFQPNSALNHPLPRQWITLAFIQPSLLQQQPADQTPSFVRGRGEDPFPSQLRAGGLLLTKQPGGDAARGTATGLQSAGVGHIDLSKTLVLASENALTALAQPFGRRSPCSIHWHPCSRMSRES